MRFVGDFVLLVFFFFFFKLLFHIKYSVVVMFLFSQSELKRFKLKLSICRSDFCREEFSLLVSLHQQAGGKQPLSKLGCIYRHLISAELV